MTRYVIFCDESIQRGKYFSNFYGAAMVLESDLPVINSVLQAKKAELFFKGEVKFVKISENYQEKYIALVRTFFELIKDGRIKIRIMFTQNLHAAILSTEWSNIPLVFSLLQALSQFNCD